MRYTKLMSGYMYNMSTIRVWIDTEVITTVPCIINIMLYVIASYDNQPRVEVLMLFSFLLYIIVNSTCCISAPNWIFDETHDTCVSSEMQFMCDD